MCGNGQARPNPLWSTNAKRHADCTSVFSDSFAHNFPGTSANKYYWRKLTQFLHKCAKNIPKRPCAAQNGPQFSRPGSLCTNSNRFRSVLAKNISHKIFLRDGSTLGKNESTCSKCFVRRRAEGYGSTFSAMGRLPRPTISVMSVGDVRF